jgi:phage terminase large subunit GpA-like protein
MITAPDALQDFTPAVGFFDGLRPEPRLTVSEWADLHRRLSSTASSAPGKWRTSRTPYLKEIMDCFSSFSTIQEVILKKGAQLGLTEAGFNWMGYIIDVSPAPTLLVMPTDAMVKKNSKTRFDPMIQATPRLSEKIKSSRERDAGNTINQKDFPGGTAVLVGANSPVGLRSMPAQNVMLDEVDAYPLDVDGEGNPIDLAKARTRTFPRRKIFVISTPTIDGKSTITKEFANTDQRYFFVACPHCAATQNLVWERMRWEEGKPETAKYCCIHCDELIEERHKSTMLASGEWVPTNPEKISKTRRGYHINSLYSPLGWYSWADAAKDYEEALKDVTKMKAFINTVLGLEYKEDSEAPDWKLIYERRENYKLDRPRKEVAFLTAGVDVQRDRIEVEVVGWINGKRSQSITYRVLMGKTEEAAVWQALGAMLNEQWEREDGTLMPIRVMAIDTGYNTSYVHEFCRKHEPTRVVAIKGSDKQAIMVSAPRAVDVTRSGKKIGQAKQWNVGVSMIKTELYAWLRLLKETDGSYPDGYCHFPQYDENYFRGITAEAVEYKIDKKGFRKYEWVKKYDRNEPLDCRVYARAAAAIFGMDRLSPQGWAEIAGSYMEKREEKQTAKKKSSFWGD